MKVELINWAKGEEDEDTVSFYVDVFEDEEDTGHEQGHEIKVVNPGCFTINHEP